MSIFKRTERIIYLKVFGAIPLFISTCAMLLLLLNGRYSEAFNPGLLILLILGLILFGYKRTFIWGAEGFRVYTYIYTVLVKKTPLMRPDCLLIDVRWVRGTEYRRGQRIYVLFAKKSNDSLEYDLSSFLSRSYSSQKNEWNDFMQDVTSFSIESSLPLKYSDEVKKIHEVEV